MVPYCTVRHPAEQAKLWRQSRSLKEINTTIERLKENKAPFIAGIIQGVGAQPMKKWATSALPGQSWHQYGEAVDCYALNKDGSINWDGSSRFYRIYANHATELGLDAGYCWPKKDSVHVQFRRDPVLAVYNWKEIDKLMREKFGQ
jgi:hypothetical protein